MSHEATARADLLAVRLALFYGTYFAAIGVYLPFWPVWLESRGLTPTEIGYVLAAAFWPRIVTSFLIPSLADGFGERRRPMILLAGVTLVGLALFSVARDFSALLALSLITGASWAAILPLGEAVVLHAARRRALEYGRIRLWGSLTFILGAIGVGEWLESARPEVVLWSIALTVACTLVACILMPEAPMAAAGLRWRAFRRLARQRDSWPSSLLPA
jgi:MFS transporter, PPP family, 3-phenylpropionic acid transporter